MVLVFFMNFGILLIGTLITGFLINPGSSLEKKRQLLEKITQVRKSTEESPSDHRFNDLIINQSIEQVNRLFEERFQLFPTLVNQ